MWLLVMAIKEFISKIALERLFSKDGVPRYRTEEEELEELKKKAKGKKVGKPKKRKPKLMDIDLYKDILRRERRNKGK